jgi:hypothetical protein
MGAPWNQLKLFFFDCLQNSLTQLQLPGCVGLSGENLTAIFECMKLNTLNISNTCLNTDFIAATLRRCPDLTSIDVSGITAISDEFVSLFIPEYQRVQ